MTDNAQGAASASLSGGDPSTQATGAAAAAAAPAPSEGWTKGWDPAVAGFVEKKAWKDPQEIVKSYQQLESKIGADPFVFPKDDAKPEDVQAFYDKLYGRMGRPESPDKYQAPEGADPELLKAIAPTLHGAGLSQKQLESVAKGWNEYVGKVTGEQRNAWIKDQDTAQAKLEAEWGNDTPAQIEHNRRAMRALGITVEEATEYMKAGTEKFMRLLNAAGRFVAEDNSGDIASDQTLGFGLTANRAAHELQTLKADKDFMARVRAKDPLATEKYNRLLKTTAESGRVRRTIGKGFTDMPKT